MQKIVTKIKDFAKRALAYVKNFPARIVAGFKGIQYKAVFGDIVHEVKSGGASLAIVVLGILLVVLSPLLVVFAAFLPNAATRIMGYIISKL